MATLDEPLAPAISGDVPAAPASRSPLPIVLASIVGLVVVGLVALLWFGIQQRERGTSGEATVPFKYAPDLTVGLFDGSTFRSQDALATGKPLVVNFWASWCVPCADEAPVLEATWKREQGRATFVGVDVEDVDSDAQAFIHKFGVTYPNGSGNAGPTSVAFGMRGVPETYFIAPDGRVVRKWNGPLSAAGLDQFLAELYRAGGAPSS